jgi:undecaprenyl-diphosphatase
LAGRCLKLGIAQAFALVPGTSRSSDDLVHAVRTVAPHRHRISFFLAIPTLVGAGAYDTGNTRLVSAADLPLFAVGLTLSFLSALVCVRWLIRFVASHDFVPFAWYRIIFGAVVLLTAHFGWVNWAA